MFAQLFWLCEPRMGLCLSHLLLQCLEISRFPRAQNSGFGAG